MKRRNFWTTLLQFCIDHIICTRCLHIKGEIYFTFDEEHVYAELDEFFIQ